MKAHEFYLPDGYYSPLCMAMVENQDGSGDQCGLPPGASVHEVARESNEGVNPQTGKCRGCSADAIGQVLADPYDVISNSPILQPAEYCLGCYNRRVIAALQFIQRKAAPR